MTRLEAVKIIRAYLATQDNLKYIRNHHISQFLDSVDLDNTDEGELIKLFDEYVTWVV